MNRFSFLKTFIDKIQKKPRENRELFKNIKYSDFSGAITLKELMNSFEVFFVCFDEPNRRKNWRNVKKHFPHAIKVEGVQGFDKALKACAERSITEHFFLIDGDNLIIESKLNQSIILGDKDKDWVLSWSAQNSVNGLAYGNGGLKFWPKSEALRIKTHEKLTH